MALEIYFLKEPGDLEAQIRALAAEVKNRDAFAAFDEQTLLNLALPGSAEYVLILDTTPGASTAPGATTPSGVSAVPGDSTTPEGAASPLSEPAAAHPLAPASESTPDSEFTALSEPAPSEPALEAERALVANLASGGDSAPVANPVPESDLAPAAGSDPVAEAARVVGVAIRDVRASTVELAVAPSHRRRGLGRRLLREARSRFAGDYIWAHGTLPAAQALAESEGLESERTLLAMSRPLVGVVAKPELADAIPSWSIAPIDPERDLEDFTALNAAAFANHPEQGKLTADDMRQRFEQDWFDPELLLLVRPQQLEQQDDIADGASMSASAANANGFTADKPLAFLWLKPQSATLVELYVLGVHPKIQGQGLGGTLSNLMLKIMRGHGFQQAMLYVDQSNEPAVRSYHRAGFDVVESHTAYAL